LEILLPIDLSSSVTLLECLKSRGPPVPETLSCERR